MTRITRTLITRMTSALLVGLLQALMLDAQIMGQQVAPATGSSILKSADLQSDAVILRKAYEALHPGLYRYSSKAEMDTKFDALQKSAGARPARGAHQIRFLVWTCWSSPPPSCK